MEQNKGFNSLHKVGFNHKTGRKKRNYGAIFMGEDGFTYKAALFPIADKA